MAKNQNSKKGERFTRNAAREELNKLLSQYKADTAKDNCCCQIAKLSPDKTEATLSDGSKVPAQAIGQPGEYAVVCKVHGNKVLATAPELKQMEVGGHQFKYYAVFPKDLGYTNGHTEDILGETYLIYLMDLDAETPIPIKFSDTSELELEKYYQSHVSSVFSRSNNRYLTNCLCKFDRFGNLLVLVYSYIPNGEEDLLNYTTNREPRLSTNGGILEFQTVAQDIRLIAGHSKLVISYMIFRNLTIKYDQEGAPSVSYSSMYKRENVLIGDDRDLFSGSVSIGYQEPFHERPFETLITVPRTCFFSCDSNDNNQTYTNPMTRTVLWIQNSETNFPDPPHGYESFSGDPPPEVVASLYQPSSGGGAITTSLIGVSFEYQASGDGAPNELIYLRVLGGVAVDGGVFYSEYHPEFDFPPPSLFPNLPEWTDQAYLSFQADGGLFRHTTSETIDTRIIELRGGEIQSLGEDLSQIQQDKHFYGEDFYFALVPEMRTLHGRLFRNSLGKSIHYEIPYIRKSISNFQGFTKAEKTVVVYPPIEYVEMQEDIETFRVVAGEAQGYSLSINLDDAAYIPIGIYLNNSQSLQIEGVSALTGANLYLFKYSTFNDSFSKISTKLVSFSTSDDVFPTNQNLIFLTEYGSIAYF